MSDFRIPDGAKNPVGVEHARWIDPKIDVVGVARNRECRKLRHERGPFDRNAWNARALEGANGFGEIEKQHPILDFVVERRVRECFANGGGDLFAPSRGQKLSPKGRKNEMRARVGHNKGPVDRASGDLDGRRKAEGRKKKRAFVRGREAKTFYRNQCGKRMPRESKQSKGKDCE